MFVETVGMSLFLLCLKDTLEQTHVKNDDDKWKEQCEVHIFKQLASNLSIRNSAMERSRRGMEDVLAVKESLLSEKEWEERLEV